jgi:tRNA modification GTPase
LRGDFSAVIEDLARELVELRMLVEATLDFPDEEVDAVHRDDALARLERLSEKVSQALRGGRQGSILRSGLQVVLAGQPNVGKSSILNRLAGEEVAIVTDIPGTTRDAVRQTIQVEGVPMHIIDTAGLRDTVDRIERIGIERSWDAIGKADVLLYVVDACAGLGLADDTVMSRLSQNLKRVIVFNKIDLSGDRSGASEDPSGWTVHLSAQTGEGIESLRRTLLGLAGWQSGSEDIFMARERHLVALERVFEALLQARQQLARSELLAEDLRLAQRELNLITGEFTSDDLLGEIFSRFCIGK